jgi:amino acid adenylation domain-containing protein
MNAVTDLADDFDPFELSAVEKVVATTEAQREVWLANSLSTEASLAYNEALRIDLRGVLDLDALHEALSAVVARHESLRATVGPDGTEMLVSPAQPLALPFDDYSGRSPSEQLAAVANACAQEVETPFHLSMGPLFRARVLRLDLQTHVLLLTAHHIVCDGWSWGVVVQDLGACYTEKRGIGPAPQGAMPWATYVEWERNRQGSAEQRAEERYWMQRYAGSSLPVLDLPCDRLRPPVRVFGSRRVDVVWSADTVAAVRRLGSGHGASLFATLLSGFAVLLQRLSGQDDLVVGVPTAGQSASDLREVVGHGVNLLPVRLAVAPDQSMDALLEATATQLLDDFENQTLTYGSLLKKLPVARDPSRLPLVSVMFNLDRSFDVREGSFPGLSVDVAALPRHFENFELFLNVAQVGPGLRLECQYNTGLFDAATVERWLRMYETLLLAAARQPKVRMAALPVLAPDDARLLDALQPQPTPLPQPSLMHAAVWRQCSRTPDAVALRDAGRSVRYGELAAQAQALAELLQARGVVAGDRVGLCLPRGADMVVALLAVLQAGATYVPLDPNFPSQRLRYYAEDARLALLVTQPDVASAPRDWREDAAQRILHLAPDASWRSATVFEAAPGPAGPHDAAYIIYTSGSTGKPKGVVLPHAAVANFLDSMRRAPGLAADDRLAAVTTLSFDIAVLELLLPLSVGAQVIVVPREVAMDGPALCSLLQAERATVMQATPAMWRLLLDTEWRGGPHFKALIGGEACAPDLAQALLERVGELWNMYGPTETTVWSTVWRVRDPQAGIRIGQPIANTTVWILDDAGGLCPVGVPGELCIGGAGLALGYWERPELTSERFIDDPNHPGERLYRTGDRARWRNDGTLEHLGRLDFQVKVRGFRIELGEIEARCNEFQGVQQSLVMAREDQPGDVRLVAYLVPETGRKIDEAALRAQLRQSLPEYMLPQHVVLLDAMPLLPNGKADRKALPAPELSADAQRARTGPRNETEARVLAAMESVLNQTGLSVDDNFFAVGGHSLLAARLAGNLSREFGVTISLVRIFEAPTAERLATLCGAGASSSAAVIAVAHDPDRRRAPLSLMQQRVWFLERLHPGRLTYNTPSAHRLRGPLNVAALAAALSEMTQRQPGLRTSFIDEDGEPVQCLHDEVSLVLGPVEDLSSIQDEVQRESVLKQRLVARAGVPFDLDKAPLARVHLFKLGDEHHVLFFMAHHIIWDGWSFDLLYQEMSALYEAHAAGVSSDLPPLAVNYLDFAVWQREWLQGDELRRQLDHWKAIYSTLPEPLELPTDLPRPARMSGRGETAWAAVSRDVADAARSVAQRADATAFMALLAAFSLTMHRLSGQTDLAIGTPVRGRETPELERVMGFFVNALPLRVTVDPKASFVDLIRSTRAVVLDAFSCPDVPFDHLVRELKAPRDESRSPLYQAFFSYQDVRARPKSWGGLRHERMASLQKGAAEDIGLWFVEHAQGLTGGMSYNLDVFTPETAQRIIATYAQLLRAAVLEPDRPVCDLAIFTDGELNLLRSWNDTRRAFPEEANLATYLAVGDTAKAARVALVDAQGAIDYATLESRSNRLARVLRERGVQRGQLVGLCLQRGRNMVVAQLAVLKAGAGYVPLDPSFPAERLAFMAEDAGLSLLVSDEASVDVVEGTTVARLMMDRDAAVINGMSPLALRPDAARDAQPQDVAYVIYTSGSTGKPKGVVVPQRAVVNFLASMAREPGLGAEDVLLAVTTLSFDIAVLELLLPLAVGARSVLASRDQAVDGDALRELIEAHDVNVMQATPSTWRLLLDAGWTGDDDFKALIGGEGLPADLAMALLARCGQLWNMYGPTETTVWSSCWRVESPQQGIRIGRPIDNTQIWVVDAQGHRCPIGVSGEIAIGGDGVTTGYWNRPELTADRFVADPFRGEGMLYRTGDRGRWRNDGTLEHLGRMDFQVKVRGYRIELGEIESALASHPAVEQAVVIVREDEPGDVRLVAYLVGDASAHEPRALREFLRQSLPDYMLPQHLVSLDRLPLLPNGKINRKGLPRPQDSGDMPSAEAFVAPGTALETQLAEIWRDLLRLPRVGIDDNFFDIGGHSMLAMRLMARISKETGQKLPLSALLEAPTVRQMAARLGDTHPGDTVVCIRPGHRNSRRPPLFIVHDGDGETLLYRNLALDLDEGQAVYGLQPLAGQGQAMLHTRIPQMAAHHVARIRALQPHGPYCVAGFCAGGVIAFEIARQLQDAGEAVPFVGLMDIADVQAKPRPAFLAKRRLRSFSTAFEKQEDQSLVGFLGQSMAKASRKVINVLNYETDSRDEARAIRERAQALRAALDQHQPPPPEAQMLTVRQLYFFARESYVPEKPFRGDVVLIRAMQGDGTLADEPAVEMYVDPMLGWEARVTGHVLAYDVPGGHSSMLQVPNVSHLAGLFRRHLAKAFAGNS